MRVDVDKIYLGDYQFTIELDTGSETGGNQLTVWCAKKAPIATAPLKKFGLEELMQTLIEPYHTLLANQFAGEQARVQASFEVKITEIQAPFERNDGSRPRLSGQALRQLRGVQHQRRQAQRQLERDFLRRELLELDRCLFDWEALAKANRTFGEERFLRSFYFGEANEKYMYNFCRKFALNPAYREDVLEGRARWFGRNALFYQNILYVAQIEHRTGEKSAVSYDAWLYHLFLWIDRHYESILALPDYQRLQSLDVPDALEKGSGSGENVRNREAATRAARLHEHLAISAGDESSNALVENENAETEGEDKWSVAQGEDRGAQSHLLDERICPALEVFQRIAGIRIVAACQGSVGTISYLGRSLLPLSTHEAQAYILLEVLEEGVARTIQQRLARFEALSYEQFGRDKLRLRSIDIPHNSAFCEEVLALGKGLLHEGE